MQELDKLWQYQQIDLEAESYERDLQNGEDYKSFVKLHRFMQDQRKVLAALTAEVEDKQQRIETERKRYELLEQRYKDGVAKLEKIDKEDIKEVERFREYFENLQNLLANERREFSQLAKQLEKEDSQLANMRNRLAKARSEYDEVKARLDEKRAAFADDEAQLRAQADVLVKEIAPALMKRYQNAKKGYAAPVAMVRDGRCTGCNMELSAVLQRKIREDDEIVDCENCGRMLRLAE